MLSRENNELLTRTGPQTRMGQLLRRFWLPALLVEELPEADCPPVRVRLLGERLVAFRNSEGEIGLMDEACPHRGASLVYGYGIGHITTLGPIIVRREFGAAAFGATYGAAASVIQLTTAFGPALFGVLRDTFGDYRPGLAIASAVTLAACLILFSGGRLAAART